MSESLKPIYGERTLVVEPYGVQKVPDPERHGTAKSQFTLWLGSNLTIADFALGFFPIALGLSWGWSIVALLVGNLMGAWALGVAASMGPEAGLPQLMISRLVFGSLGGRLPALLNYISTIGWFSVNNILGSFGLQVLIPHLPFWMASGILVIIQGCLAIFGHNLIHVYERLMSVVLAVLFLIVSVILLTQHRVATYHATLHGEPWAAFALVVAAALSYLGSWAPYAADYSRYLPPGTRPQAVRRWSFWGGFIASLWLELVGAGVAVVAGASANPIASLHQVAGAFGALAVIAIILGGTAADALNLYSNSLAAGALNIRWPRWTLAVVASLIGLILSWLGSGSFESYYDNFLLLLGYWLTPWLGVMVIAWLRRHRNPLRPRAGVMWPALLSFLIGFLVSIPFMSSTLYTGPIAQALHGADLTFYVGFLVAFGVYGLWTRRRT